MLMALHRNLNAKIFAGSFMSAASNLGCISNHFIRTNLGSPNRRSTNAANFRGNHYAVQHMLNSTAMNGSQSVSHKVSNYTPTK